MEIREVAWHDADAVRRLEAVRVFESPWVHELTPAFLEGALHHGWDGEPARWFLGTDDGVDVAAGSYETTEYDNTHVAWLDVDVVPEHRRRGHGSTMLEH